MLRPRPIQFIEWGASQQKATPLVRFGSFSSDRRGRDTQGMSASPRKRTLGVKYSPELPPNDSTHGRGSPLHCGISVRPMSAQGHKQTQFNALARSASTLQADIRERSLQRGCRGRDLPRLAGRQATGGGGENILGGEGTWTKV